MGRLVETNNVRLNQLLIERMWKRYKRGASLHYQTEIINSVVLRLK